MIAIKGKTDHAALRIADGPPKGAGKDSRKE